MLQEIIKQNIVKIRKEKKYSQAELSRKIGVVRSTINGYETGRRIPDIPMIEKLSKTLEVHPSKFFEGYEVEK